MTEPLHLQSQSISEVLNKHSEDDLKFAISKVAPESPFILSPTSLVVEEGKEVSKESVESCISLLVARLQGLGKLRSSHRFMLGDAANEAEKRFGHEVGEKMLLDACEACGIALHTAQGIRRVCREIDRVDRVPELDFTHHQEILQFKKSLSTEDYEALWTFALGEEEIIETDSGPKAHRRTRSCAEIREFGKEKSGGGREAELADPTSGGIEAKIQEFMIGKKSHDLALAALRYTLLIQEFYLKSEQFDTVEQIEKWLDTTILSRP